MMEPFIDMLKVFSRCIYFAAFLILSIHGCGSGGDGGSQGMGAMGQGSSAALSESQNMDTAAMSAAIPLPAPR